MRTVVTMVARLYQTTLQICIGRFHLRHVVISLVHGVILASVQY